MQSAILALYVASILVLTAYAIWYLSSLAAFLEKGSPRPRWRPSGYRFSASILPGERLGLTRGSNGWPRVAVVYPVYNDYEILESLQKALQIDYPDYIIIIVDDSTDEIVKLEISKLALQHQNLIHIIRPGREGLKAGALNVAAQMAARLGAKYILVLDADFEPPPWILKSLVAVAEETGADAVQGHQRHSKGATGLFGTLYRAGMAGAIIFMAGRMWLNMFPIFTGSVGLLRVDSVLSTMFKEGSISEDLRWTIDRVLDTGNPVPVIAVSHVYADGSVPKSFHAFYRQQLRWSSGTLIEFLENAWRFILDKELPLSTRLGFILQGLFYTQGVWVYIATLIPIIYFLMTGSNLTTLWPLGLYVWLIGIESIILAGAIEEGYRWKELALVATALLPYVYVTALIHAIGTVRVLLGRGREWVVTPKRGAYQHLYGSR